MTQILYF